MEGDSEHKLLILLHIPKTAGISLRRICSRQFPKNVQLDLGTDIRKERASLRVNRPSYPLVQRAIEKLPEEKKRRVSFLIQGHRSYGLHEFFPQHALYITFLRNPAQRILSRYISALRSPRYSEREHLLKVGLKGFLTEDRFQEVVDNVQTRMICGKRGFPKEGSLSKEDLEEAKKRLENDFAFVGITEQFDESLILLKRELGWKNVYYHPWNVAKYKPRFGDLQPQLIKSLEEKNEFDIALYNFACERLTEKIKEYGNALKADLKSFRRKNAFWGKIQLFKVAVKASFRAYKMKARVIYSSAKVVKERIQRDVEEN